MPPLLHREVTRSSVNSQAVVLERSQSLSNCYIHLQVRHNTYPEHDGAGLPGRAHLEVRALGDVVEEEVEEVFRLFLPETDNAAREAWVDEQGLLAGDRVLADNGVLPNNVVSSLFHMGAKRHTSGFYGAHV
ncbi:hypothetical protein NM688_g5813 [Phlebia brevispora]|uniref:Uncharacterized protein n=1 Tax=Phlebia brevispora TaxID=194682 RepID=A0ACC1SPI4_9APHY|nr:hypothetical protein NM688_g5813 [Phlebia brevispora]